jgi:hypothetical protein
VAYVDVRNLMSSELRQHLAARQPDAHAGVDRFREQTGIDIERDVDYIMAAFFAGQEAQADSDSRRMPLVLARGRFDEVRIEGLVRDQGGTVEDYKGFRLLVHDQMKMALTFLEPGLVAFGASDVVRNAIDTTSTGASIRSNDELMRLVRDVEGGDAWAVVRFDELSARQLPAELTRQLPPINWFSVTGTVNSGLQGRLRVEARDEVAAKNLADVARGFLALARLQSGQLPEAAELLNSLQLVAEGASVSLSFAVPADVIDALGAHRAERRRQPQQPSAPSPDTPTPPTL